MGVDEMMKQAIEIMKRLGRGGEWTSFVDVAEKLDITPAQLAGAAQYLIRTERDFEVMPESNQKILTLAQRGFAVEWAGDLNHYFTWVS